MKVLVACEESQEVCKAFRAKGHESYSCDIQEPSGGHPEWHILGDALVAIKEGVKPLSLKYEAAAFFLKFAEANVEKIAIENPICVMSSLYRKPDQIINPYQFGHPEQKKTCLWLKNLPLLQETDNVYAYMMTLPEKERARIWWLGSNHAKERSKTFPGIAKAMAEQWGGLEE